MKLEMHEMLTVASHYSRACAARHEQFVMTAAEVTIHETSDVTTATKNSGKI